MAHQPNDRGGKHYHQNDENDSAFPSFLAHGPAPPSASSLVTVAFVLQGDRGVEAAATLTRAREQFFALLPGLLFGHAGRFRDHALELLHLVAKLRFAADEVLFGLIKRSG
jgi:hypothetical protein